MASRQAASHGRVARLISNLIFAVAILLLLAAASYAGYTLMNTWLMVQNRYMASNDIAPLAIPSMTWTPSLTPSPTPLPTHTATPTPPATPTPTPTPTATPPPPPPPAPVQVRIPAIGVQRSIISLPRKRDRQTGAWTWNTDRLFRAGRSDLVGHWVGSAFPGQDGNMILVGHNYGYGYNGVFVRLGSLKKGQKIYVVNKAGQTFTYRVESVERVKWRRQTFGELTKHLKYLSPGNEEQITLVSCAGADIEPFPERIYVVAKPAN